MTTQSRIVAVAITANIGLAAYMLGTTKFYRIIITPKDAAMCGKMLTPSLLAVSTYDKIGTSPSVYIRRYGRADNEYMSTSWHRSLVVNIANRGGQFDAAQLRIEQATLWRWLRGKCNTTLFVGDCPPDLVMPPVLIFRNDDAGWRSATKN